MRSIDLITNALNNIASAINNLASSIKPKASSDANTKTSNPYSGNVTVTSYYSSSDSWQSLNVFEKEQLYYIYKALVQKGVNPNYHDITYDKVMSLLSTSWPSLHAPISKLISLKEKSILNKNLQQQPWKNKY